MNVGLVRSRPAVRKIETRRYLRACLEARKCAHVGTVEQLPLYRLWTRDIRSRCSSLEVQLSDVTFRK